MSHISEEELESQLERSQEKYELAIEIAENNEQPPAGELADRTREHGIYTLLLDRRTEATDWFAESAEWFHEGWQQRRDEFNEPQMAMWMLFTAILSQDENHSEQMADDVITTGIEYREPEYYVHLDNCLANLVLGNDAAALEAADELIALEPDAPEKVGSYPGLGGACRAIVDGDTAAFDEALAKTFDRHAELEEKHAETLDHIIVCIPATVFLLVARDRGLTIEETDALQSEYVPTTLFK